MQLKNDRRKCITLLVFTRCRVVQLSTQAQQVLYTDDLMNNPLWKIAHDYDPMHVWDAPDALDSNINLEGLGRNG